METITIEESFQKLCSAIRKGRTLARVDKSGGMFPMDFSAEKKNHFFKMGELEFRGEKK